MSWNVAISTSTFGEGDDTPVRLLNGKGINLRINTVGRRLTEDEAIGHLEGMDGLIAGLEPLSRRVLQSVPRLKAIARVGIGLSNIDLKAARELGIKVSNTPEVPARAVAEMTLGAMLAVCRRLLPINADMHNGKWQKILAMGLYKTRVLVVGYGRTGSKVGRLLQALGAEVYVADPGIEASSLKDGEKLVPLEEGLKTARIITLHASGDELILGEKEFSLMREGVILLNSARGGLIDEKALIDALDSGIVGGAWIDAFPEEPYIGPLINYSQVLLTPHISTYTRECRREMETAAAENLLKDLGVGL